LVLLPALTRRTRSSTKVRGGRERGHASTHQSGFRSRCLTDAAVADWLKAHFPRQGDPMPSENAPADKIRPTGPTVSFTSRCFCVPIHPASKAAAAGARPLAHTCPSRNEMRHVCPMHGHGPKCFTVAVVFVLKRRAGGIDGSDSPGRASACSCGPPLAPPPPPVPAGCAGRTGCGGCRRAGSGPMIRGRITSNRVDQERITKIDGSVCDFTVENDLIT
jgi:hypothetical protein